MSIPSLTGNILLVQNTAVNQQLNIVNLQLTGAQVDLAINGLAGLQKVLTGQYDLVLMDVQMPVMNGKQAMQSLQQLGVSTPIYALTANVTPSELQQFTAVGFTGILSKPLELVNVYQVLRQHLNVADDKTVNASKEDKLFVQNPSITALFYTTLAKQHTDITQNLRTLDYGGLIKVVHIIKGTAGSFGYDDLSHLAAQSLLLLRHKEYVKAVQHCSHLNQKLVEVLHDYHDQHIISR